MPWPLSLEHATEVYRVTGSRNTGRYGGIGGYGGIFSFEAEACLQSRRKFVTPICPTEAVFAVLRQTLPVTPAPDVAAGPALSSVLRPFGVPRASGPFIVKAVHGVGQHGWAHKRSFTARC